MWALCQPNVNKLLTNHSDCVRVVIFFHLCVKGAFSVIESGEGRPNECVYTGTTLNLVGKTFVGVLKVHDQGLTSLP